MHAVAQVCEIAFGYLPVFFNFTILKGIFRELLNDF